MDFSSLSSWWRPTLQWILATSVIVLLTAGLLVARANSDTAAIIYLVVVVLFATLAEAKLSIYLAILSALFFDYYFIQPLHSLAVSSFQDDFSILAFVGSCIVVGRVAERARRQTRDAEQRREDVERLNALGQEMMLHDDAAGLVRDIPRLIEHNFELDAVLLYLRKEERLYSSIPNNPEPLQPADLAATIAALTAAYDQRLETTPELPGGYSHLNLVFGMIAVGTLAWKPATLSREVATSIASQVAIAITRAHAIEASTRLEAARSTDRLRAALIDSLTHELRTPLTSIRAAASTLSNPDMDPETRAELASIVDEETSRLDSLIGEAMEIAEIESDGIRIKAEPLHTATFLEQAVEASRDQLASRAVIVDVEQPDSTVWFDPHIIGRALRHLLENAARYTPPNSRIRLRSLRTPESLEFLLEDNGPGIEAADLPHIFEKFYRGKRRLSKAKGSGMGLAITRALLVAHGGSIDVASTPGRGTTFRLAIPLVERSSAPALAQTSEVRTDSLRP